MTDSPTSQKAISHDLRMQVAQLYSEQSWEGHYSGWTKEQWYRWLGSQACTIGFAPLHIPVERLRLNPSE